MAATSTSFARSMRDGAMHLVCGLCFLVSLSCDRFDPSDPPPPPIASGTATGGASGSQVVIEHPLFGGLEQMVAGDGEIHFAWSPASDDVDASADVFYRLYLASGPGDQDFDDPVLETAPGETSVTVDGLTNGVEVYAVLRAVDGDGNEDPNRVEWFAVPNPIVYVNRAGTGTVVDGETPATAYRTVTQAIGNSISEPDVNIWVARGVYSENAFLFPGMFMYGGFDGDFTAEDRDPDENLTQLIIVPSPFTVDVVTMVGEEDAAAIGIDGFQLDGAGSADNVVKIEDARIRVSNCALRNAQAHGLEILTSLDKLLFVEGFVRGCAIVDNGAEGIAINALADLKIDSNRIEGNTNEGIESQWLLGNADEDSRIDITRNRIVGNGDEGIDLDLAEVSEIDSTASQGARIRVLLRSNVVRDNASSGIQIDIDFEDSDGIDARCRIEDNEIVANAVHGIALDADALSSFRIARNVINGNGQWGLFIEGSASGPVFRILHDRVLGNGVGGLRFQGLGLVDARHCVFRGNRGPAFDSTVGRLLVTNSVLAGQAAESRVSEVRYSVVAPGEVPTAVEGDGVIDDDPGFEVHPEGFSWITVASAGATLSVTDASSWQIGDVLELADDGIARVVTSVGATTVTVDPAPGSAAAGHVVFRYPAGSSVNESELLLAGSLAIDGGHPLEEDRDGSRPDIGPAGGDTPGNVGVETGIAAESASLEITAVDPSGGLPAALGTVQSVTFNRALPVGFEDSLAVTVAGSVIAPIVTVVEDRIEIGPIGGIVAGDAIELSFEPWEGPEPSLSQRSALVLRQQAAKLAVDIEPNDTLEDAQSRGRTDLVDGTIVDGLDVDIFGVDLAENDTIVVQLLAGQLESPLSARVQILDEDGDVVIGSAAQPPLSVDPAPLEFTASAAGTVYVRVSAADAVGGLDHFYRLVIGVTP